MADTVQITMPQMGESVSEGTILTWYKQEGDWVEKDETIVEVSTDKVDAEVPAPASGKLVKILAEEDQTVECVFGIDWVHEVHPGGLLALRLRRCRGLCPPDPAAPVDGTSKNALPWKRRGKAPPSRTDRQL